MGVMTHHLESNAAEVALQRTRIALETLCVRLRDTAALLRRSKAWSEEATRITVDEIESVVTELEALGAGVLGKPLDNDIEADRMQRAVSELMSGEFDVQG
jgi:hypothetical protein